MEFFLNELGLCLVFVMQLTGLFAGIAFLMGVAITGVCIYIVAIIMTWVIIAALVHLLKFIFVRIKGNKITFRNYFVYRFNETLFLPR